MCSSQCAVLFLLPLSSLPNSSALLLAAAASLCPAGPACYSLASNTFLPSVLLIQCMPFPMIMAMCPWAWGHQSQMLWNLFFSLLLYIARVWLAYLDLSHKKCRVHLRTSTWFPHLHLSAHRAQLRAELATECSRLFHHTNVCFAKLKKTRDIWTNSDYLSQFKPLLVCHQCWPFIMLGTWEFNFSPVQDWTEREHCHWVWCTEVTTICSFRI